LRATQFEHDGRVGQRSDQLVKVVRDREVCTGSVAGKWEEKQTSWLRGMGRQRLPPRNQLVEKGIGDLVESGSGGVGDRFIQASGPGR
jgi:hypothetical protein